MIYQILKWNEYFENDRSRQRDKCSFVCIPNKQDGMGLNQILSLPDGANILGIFLLMAEACSRQNNQRNGYLTDDGTPTGRPWTVSDMAILWRRKKKEIERALEILTSKLISWVTVIEALPGGDTAVTPRLLSHPELNRIELNRKEENKEQPRPPLSERSEKEDQEPKKQKHLDHVYLTSDEYERFKRELGTKFLGACIFKLNAYLTNNEKKRKQYKNHNLVIRDWVIDEVKKKISPEPMRERPEIKEQDEPTITQEQKKELAELAKNLGKKMAV